MTTTEAQAILTLAQNNLKVEPTSKQLYMHRVTLSRLIQKIKLDTGLNPLDFYDMQWLVPRAKTIVGLYGTFVTNGGTKK